ncbi:MAG: YebC/PmpR family DNA-binding transcriptional regulator [Patescibacteria group bacterium]|nr:YebC/PmpR family DNA-binding transcriptional regulator [Patescibacteria group bacterium]
MSGHSKWSTIKRQKGTADAKRGAVFTKLGNAITIAVRQGAGVENAVARAKAADMPKDNIQRAIDRGKGTGGGPALEHAVYEGFGPFGVAVMVEVITDNKNRTASELRSLFEKHGGSLGTPGCVAYMFSRVGEIEGGTLEKAVEVGALDFEDGIIYTNPEDLHKISQTLNLTGNLVFRPNKETMVTLTGPAQEGKVHEFLSAIDDLDDVQNVYENIN